MSIFKNLVSGSLGIKAATNVHLAEVVIPKLSLEEKRKIKDQMIQMWQRSQPGVSLPDRISSFNKYDRITQLNYLAIAMSRAGVPSPVLGEIWNEIDRPGANLPDKSDLATNAAWFLSKRGVSISIKSESLDISSW